MEETNPKDITTSPADGYNPSQPASSAAPSAAPVDRSTDKAAATISEQIARPAPKSPAPSAPPILPISTARVPPAQPAPVTPPVPPPPPIQSIPVPPSQPVQPPSPAQTAPQATTGQSPKPLREDIARIINNIKLPERITVNVSGGKAKLPASPPLIPPAAVAPPAPVAKPASDVPPTKAQTKKSDDMMTVHTLKDDLQGVVRDKKMSLVRAVALEVEKKRGQDKSEYTKNLAEKKRGHRVSFIVFVATVLIILGALAIYGVYTVMRGATPPETIQGEASLLFAEKTIPFPIGTQSGVDLRRALAQMRYSTESPLGSITRIVPIIFEVVGNNTQGPRITTIDEFLRALGAEAPPDLIRAFRGNFFLGIHIADSPVPVLIVPVSSYERAFAGMLAWEATTNEDLSPFFTSVSPLSIDENGLLVERQFEDAVMLNYDVRVLKDDAGAVKLLYSFPTRNFLVIAESPYSLTEILSRLRASRQL